MTLMLLYEMSVSLGSYAELGELIIYFTVVLRFRQLQKFGECRENPFHVAGMH